MKKTALSGIKPTGSLHIGHALNNTLQDILIRMKRMQGFNKTEIPLENAPVSNSVISIMQYEHYFKNGFFHRLLFDSFNSLKALYTSRVYLQYIVGQQLGIDPNKIKPEADFAKELGADSLDVVELVMSIEERYGKPY